MLNIAVEVGLHVIEANTFHTYTVELRYLKLAEPVNNGSSRGLFRVKDNPCGVTNRI